MNSEIHIERIDLASADLVIGLFDQYRVFYKQPADLDLARKFILERLQQAESVIFVALDGARLPIGFTQLYPKFSSMGAIRNWILNDLYVRSDYRRQGIGQTLIKRAMEFAAADGAKFVQLETAVDNFPAQTLYETIGFEKQQADTEFLLYKINVNDGN